MVLQAHSLAWTLTPSCDAFSDDSVSSLAVFSDDSVTRSADHNVTYHSLSSTVSSSGDVESLSATTEESDCSASVGAQ
jgi:hypothetical protein